MLCAFAILNSRGKNVYKIHRWYNLNIFNPVIIIEREFFKIQALGLFGQTSDNLFQEMVFFSLKKIKSYFWSCSFQVPLKGKKDLQGIFTMQTDNGFTPDCGQGWVQVIWPSEKATIWGQRPLVENSGLDPWHWDCDPLTLCSADSQAACLKGYFRRPSRMQALEGGREEREKVTKKESLNLWKLVPFSKIVGLKNCYQSAFLGRPFRKHNQVS